MRILHFKKGDPVPEWVLRSTCKHHRLIFFNDVKVHKYGNAAEVLHETPFSTDMMMPCHSIETLSRTNSVADMIDERPWWLSLFHWLTHRSFKLVSSRPTKFFHNPANYQNEKIILEMDGLCENTKSVTK